MKLIIQIPCYNEEETLPIALNDLPKEIPGIDSIEVLIINDGSVDKTVEVARAHAVDHIISHTVNQGLAVTFMTGINACLDRGADIIVNTDADNQYSGKNIPDLVLPIIQERAEITIGSRPISTIEHFSPLKKSLQKLGSRVIRFVSKTDVQDAPSGFRAFTKEAAMKLNVYTSYTYTLETIIQAGLKKIKIECTHVEVNEKLRESRLMKSTFSYIWRSFKTILEVLFIYSPMKLFFFLGTLFTFPGLLLGIRWLFLFFFVDDNRTHLPSIIVMTVLLIVGVLFYVMGLIGRLISVNRSLLEEIRFNSRLSRLEKQGQPLADLK